MECLICKKTKKKWFPINFSCGAGQNTIRDDILEFVGDSVINDLNDGQCVCNICMNMLDEIVTNKHMVLEAIKSQGEKKYVPKLGKFWNFYQSKFSDDYGDIAPNMIPSTPPLSYSNRDPTNLVYVSNSKPYNEPIERIFERREGLKRQLREELGEYIAERSVWSSKSDGWKADRKQKVLYRSKSTAIKKMKRDLASAQSENLTRRPFSVASDVSFLSADDKEESPSYKGNKKKKQEVEVVSGETIELQCTDARCRKLNFAGSLSLYTSHRTEFHHEIPYYRCWICGNEYFSNEHLELHTKKHVFSPLFCGICGVPQRSVSIYQKHVDQHLNASFKCFVCDMSFLSKKECNSHVFKKHRHRRLFLERKSQRLEEHKTLDQRNYQGKQNEEEKRDEPTSSSDKSYSSVTMIISNENQNKYQPFLFRDMFVKQKLRPTRTDSEVIQTAEERIFSLGDDLCNRNNEESGGSPERLTDSPGSIFDRSSVTPSPAIRRKSVSGKTLSGRSTPYSPYERLNILSDEDLSRLDLPPLNSSNNWYQTRRDLESRNSEIEQYMGSDSEEFRDSVRASFSEQGDSDLESETQYLDGNKFVSSINSPYLSGSNEPENS